MVNGKFHSFLGARAPLGIAWVKKRMKKFQNSNNLLSPGSTSTLLQDGPRYSEIVLYIPRNS